MTQLHNEVSYSHKMKNRSVNAWDYFQTLFFFLKTVSMYPNWRGTCLDQTDLELKEL